MRRAVLVNGVPASGKSSLAVAISRRLEVPLLGLDTAKEALFSELGIGDRLYNRKMGKASYAVIWALVGGFPENQTVVVDAWFGFQPLQLLQQHLQNAGVGAVVEVWCRADPEVVVERYLRRCGVRHAGHLGEEYASELRALAKSARPLGVFPCLEVDTTAPVETEALVKEISRISPLQKVAAS
ncbi:AAA family ATPase [Lichenicoccus sp.]|uniref:AAA family ATPase n=1 Tax=Lichenicoccus sp. TaxID=2781899 RepID=UPI003D0C9960